MSGHRRHMPCAVELIFVVVQSWTAPVGKMLITWSYAKDGWRARWIWRLGMFIAAVIVPIGTVASYSVCPRAFVAPIHSTEAITNCLLAWLWLDEGRLMGIETVRGVVIYAVGLVMLMLAYSRHLDETAVDAIDWGRFVLLTGAMLLTGSMVAWGAVSEAAGGVRSPWWWIALSGLYGSYDYVVSADTWLVGGSLAEWVRDDAATWTEGVVLGVFVAMSGFMSLSVLEQLLQRYPLHVVAPAVQALEIAVNVVADLFVYGRWVKWGFIDYALAIGGVTAMGTGIRRLTP